MSFIVSNGWRKKKSSTKKINELRTHFKWDTTPSKVRVSVFACVQENVKAIQIRVFTVDDNEDDLRECFEIEVCFRWQTRQQNDNEKYN